MTKKKPPPFPFPTAEHHDRPEELPTPPITHVPDEDAIDHGVEESFPASDPVSVTVTKVPGNPSPATGSRPKPPAGA